MSAETISKLIFAGGLVQFTVLIASAMVPFRGKREGAKKSR